MSSRTAGGAPLQWRVMVFRTASLWLAVQMSMRRRATGVARPQLTPLPRPALRAVLEDHALGLELVADAVGLLEVAGLARRLTVGDRGFDLGIGRSRRSGRSPAEPRLGILLQQAERLRAGAQ